MTALSWAEHHPDTSESFSKAELGPFLLFACDESWRIRVEPGHSLAELEEAHGLVSDVGVAKLAAEAWLRAFLQSLLRQLYDPANMGSDSPPGGPLSEESARLLQQGIDDVKAGRVHAHGGFEAAGIDRRDERTWRQKEEP